jgi:hypothetical protein
MWWKPHSFIKTNLISCIDEPNCDHEAFTKLEHQLEKDLIFCQILLMEFSTLMEGYKYLELL